MRKFLLLLSIFTITSYVGFSQDFSNKGKDFWVGYGYHQVMTGNNAQEMLLYFATDQVTTVTVSIPGTGYSVTYPNIPANTVFATPNSAGGGIPKAGAQDARLTNIQGISNKGIRIVSDKPIIAYAHIYNQSVSGATILYPTNTLGKEYYSVNFTNNSNVPNANCWFYVVATEPGTTSIEITPSANTIGGWVAGTTYTVNLSQGQIFNVLGVTTGNTGVDLTGSKVKSIASGTGACKKIAVYSGSGRISITCSTTSGSSDNYMVQSLPKNAWSKKYLTVPSASYTSTTNGLPLTANFLRVCIQDPTTVVTLNGAPMPYPLTGGFYYQIPVTNSLQKIEADKPIMVAQYFPSSQGGSACGTTNGDGDPEVIYLSPVEQSINKVNWNACSNFGINPLKHYINVVIPNSGTSISSFTLDNIAVPASSFLPHPQDPAYSYAVLRVGGTNIPPGVAHSVRSDSGFNAIAYGYGPAESYGYNAGTNIRDLYQQISTTTQYGIETSPSVCSGSPFKFKISLPYQPLQLVWNFNTGLPATTLPSNANVTQVPSPTCPTTTTFVCHDSTTFVNGQQIWWYSPPAFYTINTIGIYPVTLTAQTSGSDGCGTEQEINFDLEVSNPPIANFTFTTPGCVAEPVQFTDASVTTKPIYNRYWDFGDGSPIFAGIGMTYQSPLHTYALPGTYTVRFAGITTPGCLSDTISKLVTVPPMPTGTISGTTAVCQNGPMQTITFTAAGGTPPYTFTYNINGGASQTVTTTGTSLTATVPAPTGSAGPFIYNLTNISNTPSLICTSALSGQSATVTVNPLPTASIIGSTTVCQNATQPNITFIGAGGTSPYTFSYTLDNGSGPGPLQTISTTSGNSVNLPVSTSTIGTFIYNLVSVADASSTACSQTQTGTATVVVQATSTATISGTTTVCQNSSFTLLTFTAANGTAPFTFTFNINGGTTLAITTSATSNSTTLAVPLNITGIFIYNLTGVFSVPIQCFTPITGSSATVIINPVPSATISGSTTVCQNSTSPNITFTGSGASVPYTFNYTINGIAQAPVSTVGISSSVTVPVSTATFGSYIYALTGVTDGSSTACANTASGSATVTVNQLPSATITGTTTVCHAGTSPNITFTANGGAPPYTFSYTLNSTALTATTTVGNSVTVPVSTATPGTFTYNLISVQESSAVACIQNQTGSAVVIVHPKPTASFTTVGPYCSELAVTFTPAFGITPTGTIVQWIWDLGDGAGPQTFTNGNPFTVTYPTEGIKTVTFKTVSDKGCVSDIFTATVTINSKPVAGFINPGACLADANAQFYDTSSVAGGTIVFWSWDFGDGSTIFAGTGPTYQNPIHAYAAVGQKTVTLIVTTNSGCKDTVVRQFFINGEVTRAAFTTLNPTNLCSNRPVQIQENSLVNVGFLIRTDIYWDNVAAPTVFDQDNTPTPGKIYTHSYPNLQIDRTYSIRYIAYSGFNGVCQKDTIINITVRASPVAQFLPVPDVCLNGGPVALSQGSASGGTGVYMGPGITFAGGVYTFNPLATGVVLGTNNSVVYTVTSPAGCDSAKVQQIKVLAPPVVNTFAPVGNKCLNNSITFANTYTNGDGTVVKWIYNWNDGSPIQTMTTGANVTHVYATSGTHTATLTLETGYGCRNIPFTATFTVNPLPAPSYTFSNSVCLPSANVVFTNTTPNTSENTYLWSFELPSTSAANTSTLTNPSHIYTTQGPHNTHLIATNTTTGCRDSTAIIPINSSTIHPEPVVQFTAIPDVCLNNGTVQIAQGSETSGMAGGPGIYSGTGVIGSGVFNPITAGVGIHTLTYTWTSSFNCPSSKTQTVRVLAAPVVNTFTTTGNRCETQSIVFQNTVSQGAGIINTWVYDWGDGSPVTTATNGNDITHAYTLPGTYNATLYVVTNGGCKSAPAFPLQVVVNPLPKPNFTYSDTTCLPLAKVIFVNTTPNIGDWAYNWNFDFPSTNPADMSTQQQNVMYTYTTPAPHTVQLIATSGTTGCTASITKPVTSIHPAPVASFNFNKPSICLGDNVTVLDNSTFADGTSSSWTWNFGENASNANGRIQPPYTYATANTFNVKLSIKNSFGCTDDTIRAFTVYANPTANAGPDQFILEGGSTILQASATGNGLSYLWTASTSPAYLNSTTVLQPLASPLADITYTLKATALGGCVATDKVFIKVLKSPDIPNTFTPNNDGIHDFWDIKYLDTYPQNRVQVFTRNGKLVFESKGYAKPWDGNMNGKALPLDTYYYIIEPGNGRKALTGYVTIIK